MPIYTSEYSIERLINKNDISIKTYMKLRKIVMKVLNEYKKDRRKLKEYVLSLFKSSIVPAKTIAHLNELLLKEDPDFIHEHRHQYRFGSSIYIYNSVSWNNIYAIAEYDIYDSNGLDAELYKCMVREFIKKCNEELGKNKELTKYRIDIYGNYEAGKICILTRVKKD